MNKYTVDVTTAGETKTYEVFASSTAVAVGKIVDTSPYRTRSTLAIRVHQGPKVSTVWFITIRRKSDNGQGSVSWGKAERFEPDMFYRTEKLARAYARLKQDNDPSGATYSCEKEYR